MKLFERYQSIKTTNKNIVDFSQHRIKSNIVDFSHHRIRENHDEIDFDHPDFTYDHEQHKHDIEDAYLRYLESKHVSNLGGNHFDAVSGYVSGGLAEGHDTGSRHINDTLIKAHKTGEKISSDKEFVFHHIDTDDEYPAAKVHIGTLDDAIATNHHEQGLVTYSGINFHPEQHMNEERVLHNPGYTSSSADLPHAKNYAKLGSGHVLKITHPSGSTGLFIGNHEDLSPFGQEEHLSPRGMKIKVDETPKKSGNFTIWNCTRIN